MVGILLLISVLSAEGDAARVLALLPLPMRSHWVVMEPLLQELAARGHHVTAFSTFPQKRPLPNYTDVDFSHILPALTNAFSIDKIKNEIRPPWGTPIFFNKTHGQICKLIREPEFQNILKTKNQYDLVITEVFGNDCLTYFAYKLKLPLISFTTSMVMPWAAERMGLPDNPSYIPNYLVSFPPDMTLWQRTYNTVVLLYAKFWQLWVFGAQTRSLVEDALGEPLPPLHDVVANTSLMFINSYHVLDQSRPFPPNVVEVGGIHIRERQPLPQDMKTILDNSKNGVILMSFGSLVRSASLPASTIKMFLNVFSKIPQTVIFKYEEDLPEAPNNVVVRKWLPQRDIIEHENVVAVILHGGQASTIEAAYFGKPLLGVPFFADQFNNIKKIIRRNGGIQLDLDSLTEEKIAAAVKDITTNPKFRRDESLNELPTAPVDPALRGPPSPGLHEEGDVIWWLMATPYGGLSPCVFLRYKEGMQKLSVEFRDRPMTALQSAVYWTEYVIRHQGAPHLRPASVRLPFYQYLLLDVIAVLLLAVMTTILATYFAVYKLIVILCKSNKPPRVNSSKKIK